VSLKVNPVDTKFTFAVEEVIGYMLDIESEFEYVNGCVLTLVDVPYVVSDAYNCTYVLCGIVVTVFGLSVIDIPSIRRVHGPDIFGDVLILTVAADVNTVFDHDTCTLPVFIWVSVGTDIVPVTYVIGILSDVILPTTGVSV
jgi:hypothetical protein